MARKLEVQIVGDTRNFQRALGQASSSSGRFGAAARRAGKIAAIGLGAGIAIAVVGLKKAFDAAKEAQVSQKKLAAQLRASGISYRKFRGRIDEVIESQSRLAAVDDEELQDSFTNIVRVVGDVNKALKLNVLAADIAAARGMALAKAGELVGKVAGGNTGILSRYGIVLKKGATAQEALAVLQKKFGGQAKAYGDSVAGAGDRVKVALENVAETVGEMVFPLAGKVLSAFSDALVGVQKFVDKIGRAKGFKAKLKVVWTGVREAGNDLVDLLQDSLLGAARRHPIRAESGKLIRWATGGRQGGLIESIQKGLQGADWTAIGKTIGEGISGRIKITAKFLENALMAMNNFIDSNIDRFAEVGAKLLLAIINKLLDPAFWVKNWKLVAGIAIAVFPVSRFLSIGAKLSGAILGVVARLLPAGFRTIGSRAVDALLGIVGRLPGRVQTIILAVVSTGIRILGGLVQWLRTTFKAALDKIPGWIRAAFRLGAVLALVNAIKDAWNWLKKITGQVWRIVLKVDAPSLPSWVDPRNLLRPDRQAMGTNFARGGPTWVGERGPELVNLPRGSQVIPNHRLAAAGGGEVRVIVVGGDQQAINYLRRLLQDDARRNGGRGLLA